MYNSPDKDALEKEMQYKIMILGAITALMLGLVVLRAGYLQIIKNTNFSERTKRNREMIVRLPPIRGRILSSDGQIIASNKRVYNIVVDPRGLSSDNSIRQQSLLYVSELSGIDYPDLELMLANSRVKNERLIVSENIPFEKYVKLIENSENMPGVEAEVVLARDYPHGATMSHVVGYIGPINFNEFSKLQNEGYKKQDWIGKIGIENSYERLLKGREGYISYEIDAKMNVNKTNITRQEPALPGKDIVLTINLEFQKRVEAILADRMGGIVVMKPSTGEILAMASFPAFDPNIYILNNPDNYNKRIEMSLDTRGTPLINRTIQSEYPPGSIFKMVSSFIIAEEDVVPLNKTYYCSKVFHMNNQAFGCWNYHGSEDYFDALANSCDVYFYNTSLLFGIDKITEYAAKFGMGRPTGIDIPFEKNGFVPSVKAMKEKGQIWYLGNTLNTVIGQGDVTVTVLQLAEYISAIANRGVAYKPHVLKEIINPDDGAVITTKENELSYKVELSDYSFDMVHKAMNEVTSRGTANKAFYRLNRPVAGKTGTAEVGLGQKKQTHSLFAGFGPTDVPVEEQIVVAVLIEFENGNPLKYAGNVASLVFSSWIYNEDFPSSARRMWYPVKESYN